MEMTESGSKRMMDDAGKAKYWLGKAAEQWLGNAARTLAEID